MMRSLRLVLALPGVDHQVGVDGNIQSCHRLLELYQRLGRQKPVVGGGEKFGGKFLMITLLDRCGMKQNISLL